MSTPPAGVGGFAEAFEETVDEIAVATTAVPDVVRLGGGRPGEVATYLPGRRVPGIRLDARMAEVHVVVGGRAPITETARRIQVAVAALVGMPVHVHIDDIIVT